MMTVEPSQTYLCVQYIPKKNFEIPGEGSVVGRSQAGGLLKEMLRVLAGSILFWEK